MDIRLLGPFEVRTDAGDVLRITGRLRAVLAVLALAAPEPVGVESIGARVWDDDPPEHLRNSVQTLITRLRQLTGPDLIETRAGGYALALRPEAVDAGRFGLLVAAAAEAPGADAERRLLAGALREWRGAPFTDVESRSLHEVEAPRLVEQRLSAVERRIDLDLEAGRQAEVIGELRELTELHRLREPLWLRLLTALERSGRQAEALAHYERVRTLLADELGSDPGPQLRELHSRLLTGVAPQPVVAVPEQLPPGIGALVGRDVELAELDKVVRGQGPESSAPPIVLISGLAGAGKTSLALHWAHRVRDEFPAGQLFVNLRGYSADRPADLGLVLEGFLRALGEDPKAIPATIDDRAARFRTLIGRRRILLVLDNAGSAAQVRTLLPGPGPLVVVTSRARLRGLAVHHHVHRIEVGVLGRDSARALLARGLATDVPDSEAGPLGAIADLCGRLPLALAIVADRLALGVESLDDVVADLHDDSGRLDRLIDPDDAESDLRAVLSWSYQALDGDTARVFRLLGALPTGEFGADVVAAVAGVTPAEARRRLEALVAAGLLQTPATRLYQFHDLVRLYAAELVAVERAAAVDRLLGWYVATVGRCRQAIRPGKALMPDRKRVLPAGVEAREFGTPTEALDWFDQERTNLVAVIAEAQRAGADRDAVDLTIAVAANLAYRSLLTDGAALLTEALGPAERTGDPIATAVIVQMLGGYSIVLGRYDEALRYLEQALETFRGQGHVEGEVVVETNTGYVLEQIGRPDEALPHLLRALELPATANRHAYALAPLSLTYVALGRFDEALAAAEQAVRTFGELGNRPYEGEAADTLASCHVALGDLAAARHWFGHALRIAREIGDRNLELRVMQNLGVVDQRAGDTAAARASWREALQLLEDGGLSDEEVVRRRELEDLLKSD